MLYLIGLGLDLKDINLNSLEAIKKCKTVYLEAYTTKIPYKKSDLEKLIKKKTILADREFVESSNLINETKKHNIALLIYGDPLSATTHLSLINDARKNKVEIKIIHAPSILTAVSETGLQLYKFGKTASLPKWQKNYKPTSFYEIVRENQGIRAHTLLLCDIGLNINDALQELKESDKKNIFKEIIILSFAGTNKQKIIKAKLNELSKKKLSIKEPFCIIIPSLLHFTEKEYLNKI